MKDWEGRSSSNEHGGPRNVESVHRDGNPPVPPGHVEVVKDSGEDHADAVERDADEGERGDGRDFHWLHRRSAQVEVEQEAKTEADEDVEDWAGKAGGHGHVAEAALGHGEVGGVVPYRVSPRNDGEAQYARVDRGDAPHECDDGDELRGNKADPQGGQDEADEADHREAKGKLGAKLEQGRAVPGSAHQHGRPL